MLESMIASWLPRPDGEECVRCGMRGRLAARIGVGVERKCTPLRLDSFTLDSLPPQLLNLAAIPECVAIMMSEG